jgi:hypothetical protein
VEKGRCHHCRNIARNQRGWSLRTRSRGRKTWWAYVSTEGDKQKVIVVLGEMRRQVGALKLLINAASSEKRGHQAKAQIFWQGEAG